MYIEVAKNINICKEMFNRTMGIVLTDGLAPIGARAYAGEVTTT